MFPSPTKHRLHRFSESVWGIIPFVFFFISIFIFQGAAQVEFPVRDEDSWPWIFSTRSDK